MPRITLITGLQWGDEGKGKFVDFLGDKHDVSIRFNGGNNAGHTVVAKGQTLHMSVMPSAVLRQKLALIAQAVVINPQILIKEIKLVKSLGVKLQLGIDPRCHVVMPYHQLLDSSSEVAKGKAKTGSLKLGIGFCYEDRTNRAGIRVQDLMSRKILEEKLKAVWTLKKKRVEKTYDQEFPLSLTKVLNEYLKYGRTLKPYIMDVASYTIDHLKTQSFLLESAQGFYLDFVFGSYPYTVAYHTVASSALPDIGLPPMELKVMGIVKAYTTRVGNGPFPTELNNFRGQHMRDLGHEYGTVSGRPRRCGWLDLTMIELANKLSGTNQIILTKLDVLSGLKQIKVATKIKKTCRPQYQVFPGWSDDLTSIKSYAKLPPACKNYVEFIENHLGVPIRYVSVGPDRTQTISKPNTKR
ncbi:MAG: adenylosuccinate synthase [Patescibacteria group bacterium]|nr:adenylosuccinate synthase [Patescibacteria group bacterium]